MEQLDYPTIGTIDDLSKALGVPAKTIYRLVAQKQLRKLPGIRPMKVTRAALEEYLAGPPQPQPQRVARRGSKTGRIGV